MKLSLRNRFLVPVVILVAIGMGASTAVSYYKYRTALMEASKAGISQLAESTLSIVDAWFADRKLEIQNWSAQKIFQAAVTDSFVGKAARKAANTQLAKLKEDYKFYENIYLSTITGEIVAASADMGEKTVMVTHENFFQETVKRKSSKGVYVSDVYVSELSNNPVLAIASPVIDAGEVTGVLYGVLDIRALNQQFIDTVKVGNSGYAFAFDKGGRVLAHRDKSLIMAMDMKEVDFGREMLLKGNGFLQYTYNNIESLGAFRRSQSLGWIIGISAPTGEVLEVATSVGILNLSVASAIVVLTAILILVIASSTVQPINKAISGLEQAMAQVVAGAGEVASSSQILSSGASQQAATIEETSSALEEMASMTRQNADNAGAAKSKMNEAIQIVQKVSQHMGDMAEAIEDITASSEETGKIIKSIDEIAFQTNLLALNAAVEAARAGEAGAGFAVVADEVRNLAMKAAEAAKTTAELIEKTIKAVKKGNQLTFSTSEAFKENIVISEKVGELVAEIAAASTEQAQGIEEINRAMAEMDKVVQQVAATSEESAAASEEMNGQAEEMEGFVNGLTRIVSGGGDGLRDTGGLHLDAKRSSWERAAIAAPAQAQKERTRAAAERKGRTQHETSTTWGAEEVNPRQVIPMEEEDFKDF